VLNRGAVLADSRKGEISRDELIKLMTSGAEPDALTHELERILGIPTAYSGLEPAGVVASRVPRPRYASCCTSSAVERVIKSDRPLGRFFPIRRLPR